MTFHVLVTIYNINFRSADMPDSRSHAKNIRGLSKLLGMHSSTNVTHLSFLKIFSFYIQRLPFLAGDSWQMNGGHLQFNIRFSSAWISAVSTY